MLINLKNFNPNQITNISQMFSNCTSLSDIKIPTQAQLKFQQLRKKREEKLKRILNNKGT